ncbi:peptidoglycan-binding protein [Rhodobacter sp. CZR27]|uniref:peptidoglycan-binding domain-containing protein n=1 Tax=Rhodobacter sp. CZR27 TaxID=2033869 RepID=UPI000BBEC1FF|nr:peptidoglycan-binding domain-containing protein [Rhodobacter sp. CZR27]
MTRIFLLAGLLALTACQGPPMPEAPRRPDLSLELRPEKPEPEEGICWAGKDGAWFRAPCPEALTPEVLASLQRALEVRELYDEEITGEMDPATRQAVRRLQEPLGLDSEQLSLAAARYLGILPVDLDALWGARSKEPDPPTSSPPAPADPDTL